VAQLDLTESDGGRSYASAPGDLVVIRLAETPSSGYRWRLAAVDSDALAPAGDSFRPDEPGLGAGGIRQFRFTVVAPGRATVRLALCRAWEGTEPAVQRYEVTIQVTRER